VQRLDLAGQRHRMVIGTIKQAVGPGECGSSRWPRGPGRGAGHPHGAVEPGRHQEVLGHPERVEAEIFRLAREGLHFASLLERQIGHAEVGR